MRFTTIIVTVLGAGAANGQLLSSLLGDVSSIAGGASSLVNSLAGDLSSIASRSDLASFASSVAGDISSLRSEGASNFASITASGGAAASSLAASVRSSFDAKESSIRASLTGAAQTGSTGAAVPTALPAMGAIAGGLMAVAGLL